MMSYPSDKISVILSIAVDNNIKNQILCNNYVLCFYFCFRSTKYKGYPMICVYIKHYIQYVTVIAHRGTHTTNRNAHLKRVAQWRAFIWKCQHLKCSNLNEGWTFFVLFSCFVCSIIFIVWIICSSWSFGYEPWYWIKEKMNFSVQCSPWPSLKMKQISFILDIVTK